MKRALSISSAQRCVWRVLPPLCAAFILAASAAGQRAAPATDFKRTGAALTAPLMLAKPGVFPAGIIKLSASATPAGRNVSGGVFFSQQVGAGGASVLSEVLQHLQQRHSGWTLHSRVAISFDHPIAPGDITSAGLASALLLDSMIAGWELDPQCAALGGIDPDGSIPGVSWPLTRLTAALRGGASRIIISEKSGTEAGDCLLNEGVAGFARAQMFAVSSFEEAPAFAQAKLDEATAKAFEHFAGVQRALIEAGPNAGEMLRDPEVQEGLRATLISAPNHLSARLLLRHATGRTPGFSFGGSVEVIERIAYTLLTTMRSRNPAEVKFLPPARVKDELAKLESAREKLDRRTHPWLDTVISYGELTNSWLDVPPTTPVRVRELVVALQAAARASVTEHAKLEKVRT